MAEKKRTNTFESEKATWRLTCMEIGKSKDLGELDNGKNLIDTNNTRFLEGKGAEKNENGQLVLKASNHRTESEIVKGKKIVHRRIGEDGKVLYENKELVKGDAR